MPRLSRSKRGRSPRQPTRRLQLTDSIETDRPSRASTAERISDKRIGRLAVKSAATIARCTTPLPSRPGAGVDGIAGRTADRLGPDSSTLPRLDEGFAMCPTKRIEFSWELMGWDRCGAVPWAPLREVDRQSHGLSVTTASIGRPSLRTAAPAQGRGRLRSQQCGGPRPRAR
jgi:hypothetical protein